MTSPEARSPQPAAIVREHKACIAKRYGIGHGRHSALLGRKATKAKTPSQKDRKGVRQTMRAVPSGYTTTFSVIQMTALRELKSSQCKFWDNIAQWDATSPSKSLSTHLSRLGRVRETCYETGDTVRKHD